MDIFVSIANSIADIAIILVNNRLASDSFLAATSFASIVLIISLHIRGYKLDWPKRLIKSVGANIAFLWGNLLFAPAVFVSADYVRHAYDAINLPHVDVNFWSSVPAWILVPFAVFCFDFANYWNHRLMHRSWLWPIHAIHHSDPELNAMTTYRVHFLEPLVMSISYILLLSWLGFPTDVMGVGAIFVTLHNMYVHINVDWNHGPFKYVIASPRMHQWHHADLPKAYGKNLANVFPIFDVAFGTYYVPGPCKEAFGVQGAPENDVVKLTLFPFAEWGRMVWRSVRPSQNAILVSEPDQLDTKKHRAVEPDASVANS
ncbi:MAG: sterol desaturase family protein [Roseibium sp.]|uniref:sterol desaturase family protein n=1 Tax=Roseibium sp. TaxID=1936156 RepID=UPI0026062863|nr:sterol desaturase family protein [Roseibium sp.]MCV0424476.1 sterol desaturase family protein [Roseibium sp.]